MKVIIQIPCFNEAKTLPLVFEQMPTCIDGVDELEYQVIDDGSTDNTAEVARKLGVHHVVSVRGRNRRWLGRAFRLGVDNALRNGADVLVNTDGDNQYSSKDIAELVRPIINGRADLVIGDRNPGAWHEFSKSKRWLQRLGSRTVGWLAGEQTPDAVSGFRAYSREALLQIHVLTNFTYTLDTLIQAHKKGLAVAWIPIVPNRKTRESRLITSLADKVRRSGATILRLATVYAPFRVMCLFSLLFFIPGAALLTRFFFYYVFVPERSDGFVQSVVIGGVLLVISVLMFVFGIIGDLLSANRQLIEDLLTRIRRLETRSDWGSEEAGAGDRRAQNE